MRTRHGGLRIVAQFSHAGRSGFQQKLSFFAPQNRFFRFSGFTGGVMQIDHLDKLHPQKSGVTPGWVPCKRLQPNYLRKTLA
jgi:hypothetical protein